MNHHLSPSAIVTSGNPATITMSPTTIAEITSPTSISSSTTIANISDTVQNSSHKTLINQNNDVNDNGKITKVINSKLNGKPDNADGFRIKNAPLNNGGIDYKQNIVANDCDRLIESKRKNSNTTSTNSNNNIHELITIVTISDTVENKIENNLMSPLVTSINSNDCNITNGNSKNEIDILAHL